jgi:uncharacterized membrane protein (Fun14 family)
MNGSWIGVKSKRTRAVTLFLASLLVTVLLLVLVTIGVIGAETERMPTAVLTGINEAAGTVSSVVADTSAAMAFPFGYYGLEVPEVENDEFTPRVYIDSGMDPEDIAAVMGLASSGGVQV